jgi:hypothetical protein
MRTNDLIGIPVKFTGSGRPLGWDPRDDVHRKTARIDRGVRATDTHLTTRAHVLQPVSMGWIPDLDSTGSVSPGVASQAPRRPMLVACSTAALREETPSLR